ncbi:DUF6701 domain-containing protein [Rheinheimera marina]|uniref:DUF6701 domain-containing protein n=1 Tax=Rheinheimera marina TaxID=1774958 RepID=A0ABV9JG89_9GAMM
MLSTSNIKILSYSGFDLVNVTLGDSGSTINLEAQGSNITRLTGSTLYGSILGSSNNVRLMTGTVVMGAVNVTGNFQGDGATIYGAVSANNGISASNTTFHSNLSSSNSSITLTGGRVKNNVTVTAQTLTATGTVFEGNITANGNVVLTNATVSGKVTSTANTVKTTNSVIGNGISGYSGIQVTGGTIAGDLRSSCNNVILTNTTMTSGTIQTTPNLGSGCGADRVEFNNSTINANILGGPNNVVLNDTDYTGNIQARFNVTLNDSTLYGNIYGETNYDLQKVKLQDSFVYGSVTVGTSWQTIEGNWPNSAIYGECTYHTVQPQPLCQDEPPAPAGVNHFRLSYPVQGITCQSSAVLIEACADASCSSRYTDTVTLTLSANNGGAWIGGNQITLSNGMATKYLSKTSSGDSVLGISAASVTASAAAVCLEGTTTDAACSHSFLNTGLRFSTIPNQVAGLASPSKVKLQVVRTDTNTGACVARVTPSSAVQFGYQCVNPTSCITGQSFTVDTTAIADNPASTVSQYTSINRSFNSSAETEFTIQYSDAGQLRLHARLALAASANEPAVTLVQESNSFVTRPHTLVVVNAFYEDESNSISKPNPGTTTEAGQFIASGDPFSVVVEARNASGNTTPNFGQERDLVLNVAKPELIDVAQDIAELVYPSASNPGNLSRNDGAETTVLTGGRQEIKGVRWNEAGTIKLTARLANGSYLGSGDVVAKPASANIGRFYPAEFQLSASSNIMDACTEFTYMDQPAIQLAYQLQALNRQGNITTNYNANYQHKYGIHFVAANGGSSVNLASRLQRLDTNGDLHPITPEAWNNGVSQPLTTSWTDVRFVKPNPVTPIPAGDGMFSNLKVGVTVIKPDETEDETVLAGVDMAFEGCLANENCAVALTGDLDVRYGRLMIEDAFGPEDEDLPIQFVTQYWDPSTHSFVRNTEDQCSAINATHLAVTGVVTTASGNTTVTNGLNPPRSIMLSAPGAPGSAVMEYDLQTGGISYLGYPWTGGTSNQNPKAEAIFGRYRGNKRQIYWQEKLN